MVTTIAIIPAYEKEEENFRGSKKSRWKLHKPAYMCPKTGTDLERNNYLSQPLNLLLSIHIDILSQYTKIKINNQPYDRKKIVEKNR